MDSKTLRVRARGTALVQRLDAVGSQVRQYVGRAYVSLPEGGGFAPTADDVELPNIAEYRQAVKEQGLWAADEETAKACGVPFDEFFGEE